MDKEKFISEKMKVLVGKENYSRSQAYAIALSYWNDRDKAQQGLVVDTTKNDLQNYQIHPIGNLDKNAEFQARLRLQHPELYSQKNVLEAKNYLNDKTTSNLRPIMKIQDGVENTKLGNGYYIYYKTPTDPSFNYKNDRDFVTRDAFENTVIKTPAYQKYSRGMQQGGNWYDNNSTLFQLPQQNDYMLTPEQLSNIDNVVSKDKPFISPQVKNVPDINTTDYNTNRVNILNPYGDVSLEYALNLAGKGFGSGDYGKASLGTGLSLIKGARNLLTGFSTGRESKRIEDEYLQKRYDNTPSYQYAQQGGIKNSDIIAQNAIVDDPSGNINLEGDEFVKRTNGQVQPVIGDKHIENGKIGKGVDAKLNNGDKVLSNYLKLRPTDIKELKERYEISVKKGATFAEAQKKLDSKLGIKTLESEKSDTLQKIEKVLKIQDLDTRTLNLNSLSEKVANINEKLNTLSGIRANNFEFLFQKQEQQPKKGTGKELFDEDGKEVTQVNNSIAQQGGEIEELAKKHGIPLERAFELLQQGGVQTNQEELQEGQNSNLQEEQKEISPEQIVQAFAQLTQQDPQQIVTQLEKMQPDEQQRALEQMVQALQQGQQNPQEDQIEGQMSNPQEEQKEVAQKGGYSFSTRYVPNLKGYDAEGNSILNQDTLSNVEDIQSYTGKGYGQKMADVEKTINMHNWYFDSEKKKEDFRNAVKKEGEQPEVKAFQEAYNRELEARAEKAGLPKDQVEGIKKEVGFSNNGVQKVDGLFGAFTSTRPLYNFSKKDGDVQVTVDDPITNTTNTEIVSKNNVKNIMPNFSTYIPLFSPMQSIAKENINIPRLEPIKATTEPMLAEQERQRQTDMERIQQSGLSPQQQEATLAQGLASSQMASNDAISKVEQYNASNQFATDQYNVGAQTKQDIMNSQFRQDYQNKAMQTMANEEESMRNQYRSNFLQEQANSNNVIDMNRINLLSDQFAISPTGIEALNNKPYSFTNDYSAIENFLKTATPEQILAFKKQKGLKNTNTYNTTSNSDIIKNIYGNKVSSSKSKK